MADSRALVGTTVTLLAIALAAATCLATSATEFNSDLALEQPALERVAPTIVPAATPRLARRVHLVIVDGLRLDHTRLPFFDRLRAAGVDAVAAVHYPTWSRPSYITMLTGVPPPASGVRTNRVPWPVELDSVMERARTEGLRVATASDIGMVPPLFLRPAGVDLGGLEYPQTGDLVTPPPGHSWPFDDVRKGEHTDTLEPALTRMLARPADLVIVLAGDVDRAGHAYGGASEPYREAAVTVDAALGRVFANVDLARDTIVLTADHGHVDRGGHGGVEPEVARVALIFAGAGIVPGARVVGARLADVAPTIAALLGIPAPGHGTGRALAELLQLSSSDRDKLADADRIRAGAAERVLAEVSDSPDIPRFAILAVAVVIACLLARRLARRGSVAWPHIRGRGALRRVPMLLVGVLGFVVVIVGLVVICDAKLSPSEVPTLYRLQRFLAVFVAAGIALQVGIGMWVLRRQSHASRTRRLALANGLALAGLVVTLVPVLAVTAWFAPPYLEVPGPGWLVAIPAGKLAGVCTAAATAFALLVELAVFARRRVSAS